MKKILLTCILACGVLACDTPVEENFRLGPEVLYLTQNEAQIDLVKFSEIVLKCKGIEKSELALTFTAHPPLNPKDKTRVLGLGFSTMATDKLIDCYRDQMLELGAHP